MSKPSAWQGFRKEIIEAQDLLKAHSAPGVPDNQHTDVLASALPSLLEQCREMARGPGVDKPRPLRSIHHFACTGGTLISRCVGAMANTQVLSEVDPLSTIKDARAFSPTDLIWLARFGIRPPGQDILLKTFLAGLGVLSQNAHQNGMALVLRDHAHSQFSFGADIPERPTLRDMLKTEYTLYSLVSVRHPLDSYLSLCKRGWVKFAPANLEEYARRYNIFLDRYDGVDILHYENFVADPETQMQNICRILDLSYNENFQQIFPALDLTGGSGRGGTVITAWPRRPVSDEVMTEIEHSAAYVSLCARLGYNPAPKEPASPDGAT